MKVKRTLAAIGVAVAMLATAACGGGSGNESTGDASSQTGASGGAADAASLTIGEVQFPTSFAIDGYSTAHQVAYFNAVFDTLIRQDGDGTLVPGLATDWTYDDTLTQLTLTLREGVTFTDGSPFNADAVVANVEAFRASSTADLSNAQYIASVSATDPTHVVFTLTAPDPMLTRWMSGSLGYMAAPASLDDPAAATEPVGSGPYTLDTAKTVVGSTYVFTKNPEYWDDSYTVYDTLTINYYETPTALLNALQGGQLDAATFSDVSSLTQVENAGYNLITSQLDWMGLILLDRDGTIDSPLGDVKVRQAINYAIDRDGILQAIQMGKGTVTSSVFGEATAGFDPDLDSYYTYDVDKAKDLMAQAGYADGFTITMPTTSVINQSLLATIAQQLSEIGITVNYTDVGSNFITDLIDGKYTASWMQLASANDWQFAQLALVPNATFNPFGTETDEANALFTTMQTGTEEEAAAASKELNQYLTENAWFAPFFRIDNIWVAKPGVSVTMAADNVSPYLYLIQPAS